MGRWTRVVIFFADDREDLDTMWIRSTIPANGHTLIIIF